MARPFVTASRMIRQISEISAFPIAFPVGRTTILRTRRSVSGSSRLAWGKKALIWLHAVASGIATAPSQDVLSLQDLNELVPREFGELFLYFQDNVLIIAAFGLIPGKHPNARKSGQFMPILKIVPAVMLNKFIQALQVRQAHSCTDFRPFMELVLIYSTLSYPWKPKFFMRRIFEARSSLLVTMAAPESIEEFRSVEAKNFGGSAETTDHLPVM